MDSEGEVVGFENLVFAIFDYVHALVDNPKLEGAVKAGLTDLMFYVIVFMQMTDEQVWSLSPFYSVDFSQSRIGVKKCVFNKRPIKVCVSCC